MVIRNQAEMCPAPRCIEFMISRRRILQASAALLAAPSFNHGAEPSSKVIASLARDVILTPPPKTLGWFHPRCCLVPNAADKTKPTVLMTVQSISWQ